MADESHNDTIQRCPHDSANPYTMVSAALIRDATLSPACRWLLIYLLSNAPGWKIKTKQVMAHVKGHDNMGRDNVRALFNEACDAGYMRKEQVFGGYRYFVSETPKFKKCLQSPEIQGPGIQGPEIQAPLSSINKKEKTKNEEDILSEVQAPADAPPSSISEEPKKIAHELFERVKQIHPTFKEPNFANWEKTLNRMHRRDKRSWEEIRAMISWASEDAFWYKVIQSPDSLRKHWDNMAIQASPVANKSILARNNREIALSMKQHLMKSGREKLLWVGNDHVTHTERHDSINLDLPTETFEPILCNWFGLKKE